MLRSNLFRATFWQNQREEKHSQGFCKNQRSFESFRRLQGKGLNS